MFDSKSCCGEGVVKALEEQRGGTRERTTVKKEKTVGEGTGWGCERVHWRSKKREVSSSKPRGEGNTDARWDYVKIRRGNRNDDMGLGGKADFTALKRERRSGESYSLKKRGESVPLVTTVSKDGYDCTQELGRGKGHIVWKSELSDGRFTVNWEVTKSGRAVQDGDERKDRWVRS